MPVRNALLITLCAALSSLCGGSGLEGQYVGAPVRGLTIEQALRQYHVALTRPALIRALQSSEPQVRLLAASKLLDSGRDPETIALVQAALGREKVIHAKLGIALALAEAGDDIGFSALQDACDDAGLNMADRVEAARHLLNMGHESCVSTIAAALQFKDKNSNSREVALSLIPRFKHLSDADSKLMLELVARSLTDRDPAARIVASEALADSGKASAIPQLRAAIQSETDDAVRAQMQTELKALLERQKKNPK